MLLRRWTGGLLRTDLGLALLLSALIWGGVPSAPVAEAARQDNVEAVRALIAEGGDVDASLGDGMTALHWASLNGNRVIVGLLLEAGADVSVTTRLGSYTPLHLASEAGQVGVVPLLLEAGSDVGAVTSTGDVTALHFAASAGNAQLIGLLVGAGAEVDAREARWGQTPLMFAAAAGRLDAARALVEAGADPSLTAHVLDLVAREQEDREAQSRRDGREPAAAAGPPQRAQQAQERVVGQEVLERAQNNDLIDPLSFAGLIGGYGGQTAVLLAAREGHTHVVHALLDAGADIDQRSAADGHTPLLMAIINGHFDLAMSLMERGADILLQSDAGADPVYAALNAHWAPKSRHPQPTDVLQQETSYLELMEALLKAGADPNVRLKRSLWFDTYGDDYLGVDRMGSNAFWRAAYATDVEAMRLLVSHGADPNVPTIKPPERFRRGGGSGEDLSGLPPVPVGGPGVWPIHAASGVGYGEGFAANVHRHVPDGWRPAVRYLVEEHGADVNARDHNGFTPLHHAAARGDNELILYLVEKGADVTAVARRGQTTVDMANGPVQRISPFPETIALLEGLGAKNNNNCVSC